MTGSPAPTLSEPRSRLCRWLIEDALPLWSTAGMEAEGRAAEALDFHGQPVPGLQRRCRVQARQVYVLCEATRRGWRECRAEAILALDALIRDFRLDDGLWARATDGEGAVSDPTPDLYDLAFVLFALAAADAVLADLRARPLAEATLAAVDARMAHPAGGWVEALPPVLPRRQNPHMHLLEAMLAWGERLTGAADHAHTCLDLGRRWFVIDGTLREYFDDGLTADPERGRIVEPGHMMEWSWLLGAAGEPGGRSASLADWAMRNGRDAHGFLVREVEADGGVIDGGRRLWAQTEGVRALAALGRNEEADALLTLTLDTHLTTETPGLWMDSYDADGRALDDRVPASSLYHLMTMATAILPEPT